jgi:membrane associated rhomboid family serine protease
MLPIRDANPASRFPYVTVGLIVVNFLFFFYEQYLILTGVYDQAIFQLALIPYEVTHVFSGSVVVDLFRARFLHGGWVHLLGNMLYLWLFGDNVEDIMGPVRFLIFYLLAGVIASLAQVVIDPNSQIPVIGASGAIAGVLGAYLVRFPRARVLTLIFLGYFIRLTEIRAVWVLGFWFVLQLFSGLFSFGVQTGGGGVAYFAHIGGFVAGVVLVWLFAPRRLERAVY